MLYRRLATFQMENEPAGHTLQLTALVHEAHLPLVGLEEDDPGWRNRAHFSELPPKQWGKFFERATHPATALSPDYAEFDGSPWAAPWKPGSVDFRYDAWRTAMNWSVDWAWWAADERQRELSDRLQALFAEQGIGECGNLFALDGRLLAADRST